MERKSIVTGLNRQYYGALKASAIAADFAHDPKYTKQWKEQARQQTENINKYLGQKTKMITWDKF